MMSNVEIRALAVEWKKWLIEKGDPFCGDDWNACQVVEAYLNLVREDDEVLAGGEWLREVFPATRPLEPRESGWPPTQSAFHEGSHGDIDWWWQPPFRATGDHFTLRFNGRNVSLDGLTRGAIRRICSGFGIPLKEVK